MKAETLKKSEEFLDTYLGGNRNVSTLTWNHWAECLQDYADEYARIQIEKDRERVKDKYPPCKDFTVNAISESFKRSIDETPIILD